MLVPGRPLSRGSISYIDLDSTENDSLARPWKSFWPPKPAGEVWEWLAINQPDALRWRYQASKSLTDRPWREWTRQEVKEQTQAKDEVGTGRAKHEISCETRHTDAALGQTEGLSVSDGDGNQICVVIRHLEPLTMYLAQKPYLSRLPHIRGFQRTNIATKEYNVYIENVKGSESKFDLDINGFEYRSLSFAPTAWNDQVVIEQYIPCVQRWLETLFEAHSVNVYAYNFRASTDGGFDNKSTKRPFFRAHCDATPRSCARRLQMVRQDENVSDLLRVRFINIWRPITGPFQDSPLTLCDARTLKFGDLVPADVVFPHYCDEGFEVLHRSYHKWFYKNPMAMDEVILFKLDDTDPAATKCWSLRA